MLLIYLNIISHYLVDVINYYTINIFNSTILLHIVYIHTFILLQLYNKIKYYHYIVNLLISIHSLG